MLMPSWIWRKGKKSLMTALEVGRPQKSEKPGPAAPPVLEFQMTLFFPFGQGSHVCGGGSGLTDFSAYRIPKPSFTLACLLIPLGWCFCWENRLGLRYPCLISLIKACSATFLVGFFFCLFFRFFFLVPTVDRHLIFKNLQVVILFLFLHFLSSCVWTISTKDKPRCSNICLETYYLIRKIDLTTFSIHSVEHSQWSPFSF